jgi:hypothetical protein
MRQKYKIFLKLKGFYLNMFFFFNFNSLKKKISIRDGPKRLSFM